MAKEKNWGDLKPESLNSALIEKKEKKEKKNEDDGIPESIDRVPVYKVPGDTKRGALRLGFKSMSEFFKVAGKFYLEHNKK